MINSLLDLVKRFPSVVNESLGSDRVVITKIDHVQMFIEAFCCY